MYNYTLKLKTGCGAAWFIEGQVNLNGTLVTLNEYPLYDFMKQFSGQHVEIAVMPVVSQYYIDEKIKPLVDVLNKRGLITISSCEGHIMNPPNAYIRRFPWVAFNRIDDLQYGYYVPPTHSGWMLDFFSDVDPCNTVAVWRTREEAHDIESLTRIQDTYINALIKMLS